MIAAEPIFVFKDGRPLPEDGMHQHPIDETDVSLEPMLEGARARGVAEALEMMGQAAVLIGEAGEVLHVNKAAIPFLGATLAISRRRLVCGSLSANVSLQEAIDQALAGETSELGLSPMPSQKGGIARPVALRLVPLPGACDSPAQMVKAVVLLDAVVETSRSFPRMADDRSEISPWRGARLMQVF